MKKLFIALFTFSIFGISSKSYAQINFAAPIILNVSMIPGQFISEDFNNDGYPDLAYLQENPMGFSIMLNNGQGAMEAPQTIQVTDKVINIVAGDFNQDNAMDIALFTGQEGDVTMSIYLNNQEDLGSFTLKGSVPSGPIALNPKVFDYNNDGYLDVVSPAIQYIIFLKNNGQGDFIIDKTMLPTNLPYNMAIADFNGDGFKDIAALSQYVSQDNKDLVQILINQKDGNFLQTSEFTAQPPSGFSIAAADFNKDGKTDIAFNSPNANKIFIFQNDGTGQFSALSSVPAGAAPTPILVDDFNADGTNDLVAPFRNENKIVIYNCSPEGDITIQNTILQTLPLNLISADFNNDQMPDLAINSMDGDIYIYMNTNPAPLPVTLAYITGKYTDASVELNWKSAVEEGFSQYEIERSTDGITYAKIGQVAAKGSNSTYHYTTAQTTEKAYYRLKINFTEGSSPSYSDVVTIYNNTTPGDISLSPIPAHNYIHVHTNTSGILNIYDASGKLVKSKAIQNGRQRINIQTLSSGVYYAVIGKTRLKFVKN